MPLPESVTAMRTRSPSAVAAISTRGALGRVLEAVRDQVGDHLLEPGGDRPRRPAGRVGCDSTIGDPAAWNDPATWASTGAEVDRGQLHPQAARLDPGGIEEVVDQAAQALPLVEDLLQHLGRPLGREPRRAPAEQLGQAEDRGKRRAQLVRDGREKRALHPRELGQALDGLALAAEPLRILDGDRRRCRKRGQEHRVAAGGAAEDEGADAAAARLERDDILGRDDVVAEPALPGARRARPRAQALAERPVADAAAQAQVGCLIVVAGQVQPGVGGPGHLRGRAEAGLDDPVEVGRSRERLGQLHQRLKLARAVGDARLEPQVRLAAAPRRACGSACAGRCARARCERPARARREAPASSGSRRTATRRRSRSRGSHTRSRAERSCRRRAA